MKGFQNDMEPESRQLTIEENQNSMTPSNNFNSSGPRSENLNGLAESGFTADQENYLQHLQLSNIIDQLEAIFSEDRLISQKLKTAHDLKEFGNYDEAAEILTVFQTFSKTSNAKLLHFYSSSYGRRIIVNQGFRLLYNLLSKMLANT